MQSLLSKKIQARRRFDFRLHQPSYFSKSSFLGPRSLKGYSTAEKKPILFNMRFGASCVYVYLIFRGISMLTTRNKRKNMFLHNFSTFFLLPCPVLLCFGCVERKSSREKGLKLIRQFSDSSRNYCILIQI